MTSEPRGEECPSAALALRRVVRPDTQALHSLHELEHEAFGPLGLRVCDLAVVAEVGIVFEAYLGEERVGGCQLVRMLDEPDCFFVVGLYVRPKWQGNSLGAALLDAVAKEAQEAGAKTLALTVAPGNARALRLYGNAGFKVEETVTDLYGDGECRRLLRKQLAQ